MSIQNLLECQKRAIAIADAILPARNLFSEVNY